MAIIQNVVMRGAKQRLGGVVFYTRAGETIARELAPSVSNPRTEVQMTQRVKLANVVNMYKANKSWMAGSFEDKSEKETDYNAFVRMNLTSSKVALQKTWAAEGMTIVAPYQVSSGSLHPINHTADRFGVLSDIYTGSLVITQATTVAQFSTMVIGNNNGIVEGMQLSLIVNVQREIPEKGFPIALVRTYEVILNTQDEKLLSDFFPFGIIETKDETGNPLYFNGADLGVGAACFILSHTISGRTSVSSQYLVMYGENVWYARLTSDQAVEMAIESYGGRPNRFLDSDKARAYNPVVLNNYIQAVSYRGRLYSDGQTVPTNFTNQYHFNFYLAKEIQVGATVSMLVDGEEYSTSNYTVSWNTERQGFSVTILPGHEIVTHVEVEIVVDYEEETLTFSFIADPTAQ